MAKSVPMTNASLTPQERSVSRLRKLGQSAVAGEAALCVDAIVAAS
jgi:hypothetical protein